MANEYQITYPITGQTITVQAYRGGAEVEASPIELTEELGDLDFFYYGDSVAGLQLNDIIVYYIGAAVIGAECYDPKLTASDIRAAIGMASANLDTQLGDIPTNAEAAANKTGYKLAADGWDSLAITEPTGDPDGWTVPQKLMWLVMRFMNKHTSDNFDGIKVYKGDDTLATTQAVTEAAGVKTVERAT